LVWEGPVTPPGGGGPVPPGGLAGQCLVKLSDADGDVAWDSRVRNTGDTMTGPLTWEGTVPLTIPSGDGGIDMLNQELARLLARVGELEQRFTEYKNNG